MGNSAQPAVDATDATSRCFRCAPCDAEEKIEPSHPTGLTGAEETKDKFSGESKGGGLYAVFDNEKTLRIPAVASKDDSFGAVAGNDAPGRNGEYGVKRYDDGSVYEGQLKDDIRHGEGVYTTDSDKYHGQWEFDLRHGIGKQTWNDLRSYDGQFVKGNFSGFGRMVWKTDNGSMSYEGEYLDDLKHGHGKFVWQDGRVYEGGWCEGKRHGRGTFINAAGDTKIGHWDMDKFLRWEVHGTQ